MQIKKFVVGLLVVLLLSALAYLIYDLVTLNTISNKNIPASTFIPASTLSPVTQQFANIREGFEGPLTGETVAQAETNRPIPSGIVSSLPSECYPKDVLTSADLLPADANSLWAQVNPSGQGSLADQNFLTAGYHVGINTVGQSLRNANRQLRSEPPNPQIAVSPWMNTTIEPDLMRKPMEIGCGSP